MADVRIEIEDTLASSSMGDSPAVAHRRRPRFLAVIAAVATLTAAILRIALLHSSRPKPVAIRAVIPLPDGLFLDGIGPPELALSRDGRELFFRKDRAVMTIAVEAGPSGMKFGQERRLFEWDALLDYAVGEQGDFYGAEPVPGAALQTSIQFRTGWFTEVTRMVAAR